MKITLYELFQLCNIDGTDIADNTYDFEVFFGCKTNKKDCTDNYDKCMRYFSTKIECDKFDIKQSTLAHCDITSFIKSHIEAFTKFMNENNAYSYLPCNYKNINDEKWYELYIQTFEGLVVGNYCEEQYEQLLELLKGE